MDAIGSLTFELPGGECLEFGDWLRIIPPKFVIPGITVIPLVVTVADGMPMEDEGGGEFE